mgnify:CR=1 FL=1
MAHKTQPYEVHFVWVSGNNFGKIHRMREHMYYVDPPQYYTGDDYVSIELDPITVSGPKGEKGEKGDRGDGVRQRG